MCLMRQSPDAPVAAGQSTKTLPDGFDVVLGDHREADRDQPGRAMVLPLAARSLASGQ